MLKRWISAGLLLLMLLSMMAGCKGATENEESAAADSYVEGVKDSWSDAPEKEDNDKDQNNKDQNKEQDKGNQKPSGGSSQKEEKPADKKDPADKGGNSDQQEDQDQNDEQEEPSFEDEDPYANTPISKTPAKTDDGVSYYVENKIKVVSYNVRCANDANGHSVDERQWRLDEILQKYDADIMGFQEVTETWDGILHLLLADKYDYEMVYRAEGSGNEAGPIFYKKSKFKLLDTGHFWLSDTPVKMSKAWGADHYRIATWVKLQVRQTGDVFYYFNTHVDYVASAQVPSAELLIQKVKAITGGKGAILTGDFNLAHSAPAYATLCSYFSDSNMATVKDTAQGTFPNYGKNKNGGNIIDYCFFTPGNYKALTYKVMTDMVDGKYASDHFGVYSEIIIL